MFFVLFFVFFLWGRGASKLPMKLPHDVQPNMQEKDLGVMFHIYRRGANTFRLTIAASFDEWRIFQDILIRSF